MRPSNDEFTVDCEPQIHRNRLTSTLDVQIHQAESTSQKKEIMDVPILLGFGRNQFWQAVTDHQHTSGQEVSEPMLTSHPHQGSSNQGSSMSRRPS